MCLHIRSLSLCAAVVTAGLGQAFGQAEPLAGAAAFGGWRADTPGLSRIIRPDDLPEPGATPSVANFAHIIARAPDALPQAPAGFKVELFAEGLSGPRELRVAPNGDIFVAETHAGRVRVFRSADGSSKPSANRIFARGLNQPFGIAFYPSGNNPQWVYIANTDSVVRFPYAGDLEPSGKPEIIVAASAGPIRAQGERPDGRKQRRGLRWPDRGDAIDALSRLDCAKPLAVGVSRYRIQTPFDLIRCGNVGLTASGNQGQPERILISPGRFRPWTLPLPAPSRPHHRKRPNISMS